MGRDSQSHGAHKVLAGMLGNFDSLGASNNGGGEMMPVVLERVKSLGFKVFGENEGSANYDMNLVAIRAKPQKGQKKIKAGEFRDLIFLIYRAHGQWVSKCWTCTTSPGTYYLKTASKDFGRNGTAVVVPGQYAAAYKVGHHKNYEALRQCGPLTIYRDGNKDDLVDIGSPEDFETGSDMAINIHRASATKASKVNSKWSAGCCVINDPKGFAQFMNTAKLQVEHGVGKTFTYTLLDQWW